MGRNKPLILFTTTSAFPLFFFFTSGLRRIPRKMSPEPPLPSGRSVRTSAVELSNKKPGREISMAEIDMRHARKIPTQQIATNLSRCLHKSYQAVIYCRLLGGPDKEWWHHPRIRLPLQLPLQLQILGLFRSMISFVASS